MPSIQSYKVSLLGTKFQDTYQVNSEFERYRLLRELFRKVEPVTIHLGQDNAGNDRYYVSSLLEVDRDANTLSFEQSQQTELNQLLTQMDAIPCATRLDRVPIEFILHRPIPSQLGDQHTFTAALPEQLLRLQRRAYFRLPISSQVNAICQVLPGVSKGSSEQQQAYFNLEITDLSVGGIGCDLEVANAVDIPFGALFEGGVLHLPDCDPMRVDLQVKNIYRKTDQRAAAILHIGFAFVDLSESHANLIQKYIYNADRDQMKEKNGNHHS